VYRGPFPTEFTKIALGICTYDGYLAPLLNMSVVTEVI
jgi:hypothetical protein